MAYSNLKHSTVPALLTTAEAALLTAPAGKRYKITSIRVTDYSGSGSTYTMRVYAATLGAAAAANVATAVTVTANDTVVDDEVRYLENGQILAGLAAHNTRLNYSISYEVEK